MDATFGGTEPEDLRRKEETLAPFQTLAKALESGIYRGESLGPGDQIQHYRIIDRLGAGGMSEVFEAEHIYLKQKVALKTPLSREHRPEIPTSQFVQ